MQLVKIGGTNVLVGGTLTPITTLSDRLSLNHFWDVREAQLATPTAAQISTYGVSSTPRCVYIPDRGSGNMPMLCDKGFYGDAYVPGNPPMPGPQLIASSARFNGLPALKMDTVSTSGAPYSMMSPNTNPFNSATWFNSGSGYAAPYWLFFLSRCETATNSSVSSFWDSTRGDIGTGPTIGLGARPFAATDNITASCWNNNTPGSFLDSGHLSSQQETYLIICQVTAGTNASTIWVYTKDANGVANSATAQVTGTLTVQDFREVFLGWVHQSYFAFAGVKSGTVTFTDLFSIVSAGLGYVPAKQTFGTEP